jgi:hypothetical protein
MVFPRLIKVTAGVFSNTLMSPGNIRRNIVSGLVCESTGAGKFEVNSGNVLTAAIGGA